MFDFLRIILIVLVLVFLIKKKWDLGLVLLVGSLLAAVAFRLSLKAFIQNLLGALFSGETLSLVAIILLVLYLGTLLQAKGNFKTLVDSL